MSDISNEPLVKSGEGLKSNAILGKATMISIGTKVLGEVIAIGDLSHTALTDKIDVTPFVTSTLDPNGWRKRKYIEGLEDSNQTNTFEVTLNYIEDDAFGASTYTFGEIFDLVGDDQLYKVNIKVGSNDGVSTGKSFVLDARVENVIFNAALDSQLTFRVIFNIEKLSYS